MHTHRCGYGASSADMSSPRDDRRERLIDAALELFARQGYDATDVESFHEVLGRDPTTPG